MAKKVYRTLVGASIAITIFAASVLSTNAYVVINSSSWRVSNPSNVTYRIGTVGPYTSNITSYAPTWASYCSEIGKFTNVSSGEDIFFTSDLNLNNGVYASASLGSGNSKTIVLYYHFAASASTVEKNETIVHEVGHALGLNHTQTSNNSIAVMREYGFNNKAYPLSDDISGIAAIY